MARTQPQPQSDGGPKSVLLQVRISEELRDDAAAEAEGMGVSLSDFVRMAMIQLSARLKREREGGA